MDASSTHMRWIFSDQELHDIRAQTNTRVRSDKALTEDEALTVQEEQDMLLYYAHQVGKICDNLNRKRRDMPPELKATALTFFRRFFIYESLMRMDQADFFVLMFTCVFVACKAEEWNVFAIPQKGVPVIPVKQFLEFPDLYNSGSLGTACRDLLKVDEPVSKVEEAEVKLLAGNKFHMLIHHPFKAMIGWIRYLLKQDSTFVERDVRKKVEERAKQLATQAILTDLIFLHPPSRIALGALKLAFDEHNTPIDRFIEEYFREQNCTPEQSQKAKLAIGAITEVLGVEVKDLKLQDLQDSKRGKFLDRLKSIWKKNRPKKSKKGKKRSASPAPTIAGESKKTKTDAE